MAKRIKAGQGASETEDGVRGTTTGRKKGEPSFNLLDEPWIPVIWRERPDELGGKDDISGTCWHDGPAKGKCRALHYDRHRSEIGILDALSHAEGIREVYDDRPLATLALNRFLFGVYRTATSERSFDDAMAELRNHCDLWSTQSPFLQDTTIPTNKKPTPVASLQAELPGDTTVAHFAHVSSAKSSLNEAECARGLVVQRLLPTFGRSSDPHGALKRPLFYLAVGKSLKDSFNLLMESAPAYPQDSNLNILQRSMGSLFWQYRRWRLCRDASGLVKTTLHERCNPAPQQVKNDAHASPLADRRPSEQAGKPPKPDELTRKQPPLPLGVKKRQAALASEWRHAYDDVLGQNQHPVRKALKSGRVGQIHVVQFPTDQWKFFHTGMTSVAAADVNTQLPNTDTVREFFEAVKRVKRDVEIRLGLEKKPKDKPLPFKDLLPCFNFALFERLCIDELPDTVGTHGKERKETEASVRQLALQCFSQATRVKGLPWQERRQSSTPRSDAPNNGDDESAIAKFLRRLADRTRVPLGDIELLRQTKSGGADTVALTDMLNEHVRDNEFRGISRRPAWMIARLFSLDPYLGTTGNFGSHLKFLWPRGNGDAENRKRERLARGFETLLHTPAEQLEMQVTGWIRRLRAARRSNDRIPYVHWVQLYRDLRDWNEGVKTRWRAGFEGRRS